MLFQLSSGWKLLVISYYIVEIGLSLGQILLLNTIKLLKIHFSFAFGEQITCSCGWKLRQINAYPLRLPLVQPSCLRKLLRTYKALIWIWKRHLRDRLFLSNIAVGLLIMYFLLTSGQVILVILLCYICKLLIQFWLLTNKLLNICRRLRRWFHQIPIRFPFLHQYFLGVVVVRISRISICLCKRTFIT